MIGQKIGPYEILAELGRGGMGEVYRGRDGALNRDVAIKVLPELFATDPERLARFTREAQTLAALNHPNIAQIFGLDGPDRRALVMELVEGEDLATLIARGPLALGDALPIARQIADALETAHDAGIVHRDLKPANIKVRPDGAVKVLDFGLAKAMESPTTSAVNALTSPTMTAAGATQLGMIIGTAAYMAPEQARGRAVDKRADIWAFGVVLYELLTGARAFKGEEISDVLAAVLRQDIDWTLLPAETPPRVRRLLERCLDRDPKSRLRDIGEARLELAKIDSGAPDTAIVVAPSMPASRGRRREAMAWTIAGAAVVGVATLLYIRPATPAVSAPSVQLAFVPGGAGVIFEAAGTDAIIVSPDGRHLVFTGRSTDGKRRLYARTLDGPEVTALPGTEGPIKPFWSPDSKSIGFGSQGKLRRVELAGGRPTILADAPRLNGGAWGREGVIVFAPDYNSGLAQVSDKGGAATLVISPDPARQEIALADPCFLPDGRHFVYSTGGQQIRWGSIANAETGLVTRGNFARFVAPDRLVFFRAGTMSAGTFDPDRRVLVGEPIAILDAPDGQGGEGRFSVSDTGVLILKNTFAPDYQLTWVDRQGRAHGTIGPVTRLPFSPRISPDGRFVAYQERSGDADRHGIWVMDLQRNLPARIHAALGQYPQWSLDGRQLAWTTQGQVGPGIYQKAATGLGSLDLIVKAGTEAGGAAFINDWSKDGRYILYHTRGEKTRVDVWAIPLTGDRKPHPVLDTEFDDGPAQLSPDGRWLAYRSDVSGTHEIYVQSFTADGKAGGDRVRISSTGGDQPRFRPDGQELFYLADDGRLMAVSFTVRGSAFEPSAPKALFMTRTLPRTEQVQWEYDVTRDGQRFLIGSILEGPRAAPPPPTIVFNWMADAKR